MFRLSAYLPFVAAMALVVVASNVLVQFPVQGEIGGLALADILTWGAFTYPFAFLVTDLANRRYGPSAARADRLRRLHAGGRLLDRRAAAAVQIRPHRIRDGGGPAGAHRGRLGRRLPDRATARRDRVQLAAPALLVARAGVRLAGRLGVRHGDLLQRRLFAPAFAFVGPSDAFALENAPLLRRPAGRDGALDVLGARAISR